MYSERNILEVEFNDPDGEIFKRANDSQPMSLVMKVQKSLPQQLDPDRALILMGSAEAVSSAGTGVVILVICLQQCCRFGMNSVLGNVRNLQFVTHLMMMQLIYSAGVSYFYSLLFEFVTYDIVPSDEIYEAMFEIDSNPYSDQADLIGYGYRYSVVNTGSLLFYIILNGLRLALYYSILKFCIKFPRCKQWASNRQDNFLWSGSIDFFSELYLCVAFSLGINSSYF